MAAGKNRPHWRARLGSGRQPGCNAIPPKGGLRFGSVPERFQCRAIARSTGERYRQPALHGARHCGKHGGHRLAYRMERKALGEKVMIPLPPIRYARAALAALGAAVDKSVSVSIIERGRYLEETKNRTSGEMEPGGPQKIAKHLL